jgi:hypothetical protein
MITRASSLTGRRFLATIAFLTALSCDSLTAETALTPLTTLRHETRELLRQEATLDDGRAKDAAIAALCDLYVVLRNDDRYATSEMLQGDAAKVRRRLLSIAHRRESQLKRQKIEKPSSLSGAVDSAIDSALADGPGFSDQVKHGLGEQSGQGGGALPDTGWQLVELIQRVVAPDFWDRQGGPGTIRYFAMRRVLVVRATTDVHEQIKDLLMALR